MKSRNKRIRTDYDNSKDQSQFKNKQIGNFRQKRKSALSIEPQTYVTRTLSTMNHQTKYDNLNIEQIQTEKQQLLKKIKEINQMINRLLGREIFKKSSRVLSKATITHDMAMDYPTLSKEVLHNHHKINSLQEQLAQNIDKLAGLNSVDAKIDYGRRIAETEIKMKELKEQLGRIKKNKHMREKQIMKGNIKESQQIQDLQQDYINVTRKSQLIQTRLHSVQQELADTQFSLQKQNQYYNEVKVQFQMVTEIQDKLQSQNQEMHIQYSIRKRKLQLYSKRNEKEQQGKKKKYYNLLLQYQQYKTRQTNIQQRIANTVDKNESVINDLQKLLTHLKSIPLIKPVRKSMHQYQKTQQVEYEDTFLTNNQQRQYISQSTDKNHSPFTNKSINQNQLNKANANRSFVRKWNLQGSIIHQNISPMNINLQQINKMEEVQSDEEGENRISKQTIRNKQSNRDSKKSRVSKQIKRIKTQINNSQQFVRQDIQQQYEQDFQT